VIRRGSAPLVPVEAFLRHPPDDGYRGEKGDKVIAELNFARRPVHIVPSDSGRFLLAFSNRSPDGTPPTEDALLFLEEEGRREKLDYAALPQEPLPEPPPLRRELPAQPPAPPAPRAADYAFLAEETAGGRFLVARQTEAEGGLRHEMVLFVVEIPSARVSLPERAECETLLQHGEELFVAAAAWALAAKGEKAAVPAIRAGLQRLLTPGARARAAQSLVALGDEGARKTLRALLKEAPAEASLALLRLPPEKGDAEALAMALAEADAEKARLLGLCLVRIGPSSLNVLQRLLQSTKPEIRAAAAPVLARFEDEEAESRLLKLARDPDPLVQTAAATALTRPPRAPFPANHEALGQALDAARKAENRKAALRLALLAAQAEIRHDAVLKALVELTVLEPKAIWALQRLTGKPFQTPDDWKSWWKSR
jgi:HEAT repeat protein